MNEEDRRQKLFKQASGYTEVFFVYYDHFFGIKFSPADEREISLSAFRDTANHINKHKIWQRTFDGLKLTSFLAYHAALHLVKTTSVGAIHDPVRDACRAGIERLSALLKLETSSEMVMSSKEIGYLSSMLYAELTDHCDAGIGANGLSTVFTFLQRKRPDPDRLENI